MANTHNSKTTTTTTTSSGSTGGHDFDETYYKSHYSTRPYLVKGMEFETDYAPAYRYGVEVSGKGDSYSESTVKTGWEKAKGTSRLSFEQAAPAIKDAFDRVIQLREERLKVEKQSVQSGEASVRKEVHTEHKSVTVPVEHDELVIERRAVNKTVAGGLTHDAAETIKVPLSAEKVVVSKDTVVKEEVSVGKKKVAGQETVTADLKREELVVDQDMKSKTTSADTARKSK